MSFPLSEFIDRGLSLVQEQAGEDVAYCRIVLYDGAFESTVSLDRNKSHIIVAAHLHHEGSNASKTFSFGGEADRAALLDGLHQAFAETHICISAAELYKWINHRNHEHAVKHTEKLLDREWHTTLSEQQTRDVRDRDAMFAYIDSLKAKLLPWWRPVSEGHVEASWLTGVDEENAQFFAAWLVAVAPQQTLDFFAHSNLTEVGREVQEHPEKYTSPERFLQRFDAKANLWFALEGFRARSLPAIEV